MSNLDSGSRIKMPGHLLFCPLMILKIYFHKLIYNSLEHICRHFCLRFQHCINFWSKIVFCCFTFLHFIRSWFSIVQTFAGKIVQFGHNLEIFQNEFKAYFWCFASMKIHFLAKFCWWILIFDKIKVFLIS